MTVLTLTACTAGDRDQQGVQADGPDYDIVGEDLKQIRADFNAMQDKIRLVFIVGPSCGICLRGMDDLNESIVQSLQDDPRVQTLAIHVPTLGAEEKHVAGAIPLLSGPRVTHYWDPAGRTGLQFQETLDLPMYAWDVWLIYEPGARWQDGQPPPMPDYWEHQLPGLPDDRRLDAGHFAAAVTERLARLPSGSEGTPVAGVSQRDAGILPVAQPLGVMISQNHESRGGYRTVKRIQSIRYQGTVEIGDAAYALAVETRRPHRYARRIGSGDGQSKVSWDGVELTVDGSPRLPREFLAEMLASYDFDGWMTDWKDKGHRLSRLGMKKIDDRLPWLLEVKLVNGRTWQVYVDSHTGDAFRQVLVGADGAETIRIDYGDYKEADGLRLPHRIQYFENGRLLATDRYSDIDVAMAERSGDDVDAGPNLGREYQAREVVPPNETTG